MSNLVIEKNVNYLASDCHGNTWGEVTLKWYSNSCYHGYLEPMAGFESVVKLFKDHDALLSIDGDIDKAIDASAKEISNLNVTLTDRTRNRELKPGIVVVQETNKGLLLSCEGPKI